MIPVLVLLALLSGCALVGVAGRETTPVGETPSLIHLELALPRTGSSRRSCRIPRRPANPPGPPQLSASAPAADHFQTAQSPGRPVRRYIGC